MRKKLTKTQIAKLKDRAFKHAIKYAKQYLSRSLELLFQECLKEAGSNLGLDEDDALGYYPYMDWVDDSVPKMIRKIKAGLL